MFRYTIKRVLLVVPTLFGAAVLVFCLLRIVPGDVCELRSGGLEGNTVDEEAIRVCRHNVGLDQSRLVQFSDFVGDLIVFDLGRSMWTGRAVTHELGLRFKLTIQIALMAIVISVLIGVPLGTFAAIRQNSVLDYAVRTFSVAGIAIPSFWLGIMIILGLLISSQALFSNPWMPPIEYVSPIEDPIGNLSQLIWPAVATGYRFSAGVTRMTRSALLEVLREDYVRTARSKGLIEKIVINRHALKNSMLPVVTVIGLEFAALLSGLVVTEQVFNLNGIGLLFVESVQLHDHAMTQALVMLFALVFIMMNFFVDILYAWLDPRIRYS
jgi:peptide/nickel transport system permease protein